MKQIQKVILLLIVVISLIGCEKAKDSFNYGQLIDSRDGQTYKTIVIGSQTWLAENLKYDAGNQSWAYDNNPSNVSTYGFLYKWEVACNVCPSGWHLPSDQEYADLVWYLGEGNQYIIDDLNNAGFNILPAGRRNPDGTYQYLGGKAYFWTSTQVGNSSARVRSWVDTSKQLYSEVGDFETGYSVRCIKD